MSSPIYTAPPIIDAIIELRFEDALSDDARAQVSKKLADKYPLSEEVVQQQIRVAVQNTNISTQTSVQERLIRRQRTDGPQMVQIGPRVLSVATGAPYSGWEELFHRFSENWAMAKRIWKYRPIDRIGLRYVNRIDLLIDQKGIVPYEDYLNLRINLPESFPNIFDYDLAFQAGLDDIKCGVTVRSGNVAAAVPGRLSFVLDIDVWREIEVPQKDKDVYELLTSMRSAKNTLFETFITDRAREIFNAR